MIQLSNIILDDTKLQNGILVWGTACKTNVGKIHKLQKWAVRTISNSYYQNHSEPLFFKYDILNVYDAYKLKVGVLMYKFFIGLLPKIFDGLFTNMIKWSDIHDYRTRRSNDFNPYQKQKLFTDQALRTVGPILWNSLTEHLKNVNSVNHFRKQFITSLIPVYNFR